MKKLGLILTALFAVIAFSTVAYADVQVTLTSPVVVKKDCEKAGAVQFSFPAGETFTEGDWWVMDISTSNVTICDPINYMIAGAAVLPAGIDISGTISGSKTVADAGLVGAGVLTAVAASPTYGPVSYKNNSGGAIVAPVTAGGTDFAFLVTAIAGTNRVSIDVIADTAGATFTVPADHTLSIKIFDGQKWNDFAGAAVATDDTVILTNEIEVVAGDMIYGDVIGALSDRIDLYDDGLDNSSLPIADNTLCINAEEASGNIIFTSFSSKGDFLTFTGDSQIAHMGTAVAITLEACAKTPVLGDIEPAGQGACTFDYHSGIANGYCPGFGGESLIIQTNSSFGQSGESYDLAFELMTDGVYFGANPTLTGFISSEEPCSDPGTGIAPTWIFYAGTKSNADGATYDPSGSCAVEADSRVQKVETTGGELDTLWQYNALDVAFAPFVYDTTVVGPGEVDVAITMTKYPCGTLFTDTLTLGTFVDACGVAAGATTLVFPYLPPLDGSAIGWWGGYVITNAGADTGAIMLTYRDSMGNTGTYETEDIAPGVMFNGTGITADMLSDADSFNESDNFSIVAACEFGGAVGFAFIGNGNEGTGYAID